MNARQRLQKLRHKKQFGGLHSFKLISKLPLRVVSNIPKTNGILTIYWECWICKIRRKVRLITSATFSLAKRRNVYRVNYHRRLFRIPRNTFYDKLKEREWLTIGRPVWLKKSLEAYETRFTDEETHDY